MDRNIVYPGSIPQDVDILGINRNAMTALGYLIQATLGTNAIVDGLACTPSGTALAVSVGPGCITVSTSVDATAFGSLAADTTDPLVKMGINIAPTTLALAAPVIAGQSQNFLIQAGFLESDVTPVTLPYVNAANPLEPYSGPGNSGVAQNTARIQRVTLEVKPGLAATSGTQVTPAADAAFVGLYAVTVAYGQTSIATGNIVRVSGAPFVPFKLPLLSPGVSRMVVLGASGSWTVPAGVTLIHVRCWGGGGAGGNGGGAGFAGGGGAGGGFVEAFFTVTPGSVLAVSIGAGGVPGTSGGAGGTTTLGGLASATCGGGGATGSSAGGAGSVLPGMGSATGAINGVAYVQPGLGGGNSLSTGTVLLSGTGGGADGRAGAGFAGSSTTGNLAGNSVSYPGAGGSGGIGSGSGGVGTQGQIVIAW